MNACSWRSFSQFLHASNFFFSVLAEVVNKVNSIRNYKLSCFCFFCLVGLPWNCHTTKVNWFQFLLRGKVEGTLLLRVALSSSASVFCFLDVWGTSFSDVVFSTCVSSPGDLRKQKKRRRRDHCDTAFAHSCWFVWDLRGTRVACLSSSQSSLLWFLPVPAVAAREDVIRTNFSADSFVSKF